MLRRPESCFDRPQVALLNRHQINDRADNTGKVVAGFHDLPNTAVIALQTALLILKQLQAAVDPAQLLAAVLQLLLQPQGGPLQLLETAFRCGDLRLRLQQRFPGGSKRLLQLFPVSLELLPLIFQGELLLVEQLTAPA